LIKHPLKFGETRFFQQKKLISQAVMMEQKDYLMKSENLILKLHGGQSKTKLQETCSLKDYQFIVNQISFFAHVVMEFCFNTELFLSSFNIYNGWILNHETKSTNVASILSVNFTNILHTHTFFEPKCFVHLFSSYLALAK
jgi:hypothetical protein